MDWNMKNRHIIRVAAAFAATSMLAGCSQGFRANVTRFHETIPPPAQGQSFTVLPDDPRNSGSLEFGHYADLVSARMVELGYRRADDPAGAQLIVHLDYDVDRGTPRVRSTGLGGPGFVSPFYDPFYDPFIYRYHRGRYVMGFRDPLLFGPGYDDIETYVVYQSQLKLKIDRADDGRVFEGTARAQSTSNRLTYLVPNLIDAVFEGFPGQDGEEVRVTIAPEPRK